MSPFPESPAVIGGTLSHFEILELLERGESVAVYKALDQETGAFVAFAVLPASADPAAVERLRRDADRATSLEHPHIVPVLEVGELPEGVFVVRPLLGESLRSRLARGPLPPEQAVGLASQVAAALGRAHEAGLCHHGLRPGQVVLGADGHARVAGFGLFRLAGARGANGMPPSGRDYRSPEQLRGAPLDERTDVWSVGLLLYEMITGRLPFRGEGDGAAESISAVHPGVPPDLDEIVARALSPNPADRPARMDDLLVTLRAILAGGDLARVEDTLVQVPGTHSGSRAPGLSAVTAGVASEQPALLDLSGAAVAHYQILEPLGGGAMGTIYSADDTRLHRTVALKFLPGELTRDPVAKARFLQEARAASALDHPNICTVHEVGETAEGHLYLAMAAYDGETVKQRIARGPLPIPEAVEIARQAAQGLAKAHREGIVHRDVKPANLMITREGVVKILDFGVAKLRGAAGANPGASQAGAFLGTPAYMSPEQARGEAVDARADLFSLGVVLYEMVAGRRPFRSGEGVTSALRSVLEDTPQPLRTLRPETPPELERIVDRMLAKLPASRFPTAAALLSDLTGLQASLAPPAPAEEAADRRFWLAAAAVLTAALLGVGTFLALRTRPTAMQTAFTRLTDFEGREAYPALAPDGRSFVYARSVAGQMDLFLQQIGGGQPVNLTAGSPADDNQPAISPDGRWIAFRSERDEGGIFVVARGGGPARRISHFGYNPAWSPDGREIAVATEGIVNPAMRRMQSQVWAIDVASGQRRLVVGDDGVQPSWSPHGSRIAYWGVPAGGARRILWTVPAAGGTPRQALDDGFLDWDPVWSPDGSFLYFGSDRSGSQNLWRLPIDEPTGEVRGKAEPVTIPSTASGFWSFSRGGDKLVYATDESKSNLERLPFDPEHAHVTGPGVAVTRGSHSVRSCDVSPDGRWVAFHASMPWEDLFVVRADGTGLRQLTADRHKDRHPFWSPDGRRLLFYSNRGGQYEAWMLSMRDGGLERVVAEGGKPLTYPVWSRDGRRLACTWGDEPAIIDLAEPPASRRPRPLPPAKSIGESFYPNSWSPDGERLAGNIARLDGSLLDGIGVYFFRSSTYERWTSRGVLPVWLHDGRRLLYIEGGKILAFDSRTYESREVAAPPPSSAYTLLSTGPDERNLFAVRTADEGDIWLLSMNGEKKSN